MDKESQQNNHLSQLTLTTSHPGQLSLLLSLGWKMSSGQGAMTLRLRCKGRYGLFHLWINVWLAGETVQSSLARAIPERLGDECHVKCCTKLPVHYIFQIVAKFWLHSTGDATCSQMTLLQHLLITSIIKPFVVCSITICSISCIMFIFILYLILLLSILTRPLLSFVHYVILAWLSVSCCTNGLQRISKLFFLWVQPPT